MAKRVKLTLDVFPEVGDKPEFTCPVYWNDCDYGDVTAIQDAVVGALLKLVDAGYVAAVQDGLMSQEQVEALKVVFRR